MVIGVLSLQGSVEEHMKCLDKIKKIKAIEVKKPEQINDIDGLIIPGGESTTISRLLKAFGLVEPIKERIKNGMPVWGTCAGLILLAKRVEGEVSCLDAIDISVKRNAYGAQPNSFFDEGDFEGVGHIGMVFIRAPKITDVGEGVTVLATCKDSPVAARSNNILVTAFHPEMIQSDIRVHRYFVQMCEAACGEAQ